MSKLPSFLSATALTGDRRGNVSLLFALIAIPVMGAIGLAVDYGRQVRMQSDMQQALDVAVLAGAASSAPGQADDITALVSHRVEQALEGTGAHPAVSVSVNPAQGSITVRAETAVDTMFMGLFGKGRTKVHASSTAVAGSGGPMEVAIAFDTTHSMAGNKLASAQQAASDLTDLLFHVPGMAGPNPNMKVGLVPFTSYVNVGLANRNASWVNVPADYSLPWDDCVDTWAQLATPVHHDVPGTCSNDGVPYDCSSSYDDSNDYSNRLTHVCTPRQANYVWHGCVASQTDPDDARVAANAGNPAPGWMVGDWISGECPSELQQLSNNPDTIKTAINNLVEGGETYIAPGLLWGWRLLSEDPAGPFHDGGPIATTKKRLILMTDGSNTHSANYGSGDHEDNNVSHANDKTLEFCNNIKAAGIEIYAIAFEVTDPSAQTLLSQCASGPPWFYNAATVSDLHAAFHRIGHELMAMRLTK